MDIVQLPLDFSSKPPNKRVPYLCQGCLTPGLAYPCEHRKFCSRQCANEARRANRKTLFWSKVEKSEGCWLWQGGRFRAGYGFLSIHHRPTKAHRLAWEYTYGPIPTGMLVCHTCDNPPCVHPAHLFLGTQQDNMTDKIQKGRMRVCFGSGHANAKLDENSVRQMRDLYATGNYSHERLASMFGVSRHVAGDAINGKNWKHVK